MGYVCVLEFSHIPENENGNEFLTKKFSEEMKGFIVSN